MAQKIIMPKQGLQMTEGVITQWLAQEGDFINEGQPLFEMETDKLSITIDSTATGTILKLLYEEGDMVPVAETIAIVGEPGEDFASLLQNADEVSGAAPSAPSSSTVSGSSPSTDWSGVQRIIMPKQGLQMTEGIITQWLVKEGDFIKEGDPLFEMETDKLSIVIDSTATGTVLKLLYEEGDMVPITETIAIIGDPDVDVNALLSGNTTTPAESVNSQQRIFSTPRARMAAEDRGIEISALQGSGPDGLIIERDVLNAKPMPTTPAASISTNSAPVKPALENPCDTIIPLSGMRKIIAERMHNSLHDLAQANHRMEVDMTEAVHIREQLKALGVKISYNDLVIRCVSMALREFPFMNSSLTEAGILQKSAIHIGMAVATDTGLLVPVIRNADTLSLTQLSGIAKDLGKRAKEGGLSPDDLTGGSFTVTNLGMFGVDSFTAIINAPEAGILAVGQLKKKAVVLEDDSIAVRPMMWLSLTYDHRIVDGAPAAQFLGYIKKLLENPALLL